MGTRYSFNRCRSICADAIKMSSASLSAVPSNEEASNHNGNLLGAVTSTSESVDTTEQDVSKENSNGGAGFFSYILTGGGKNSKPNHRNEMIDKETDEGVEETEDKPVIKYSTETTKEE
mmetsp:Transcript_38/g.53  ORF Transcript_38/g.53 Transcript_38/m.53 type:complete len:119 (-) Transcript_38:443-799(-)